MKKPHIGPHPSPFVIEDGVLLTYLKDTPQQVTVPAGVTHLGYCSFMCHGEIEQIFLPEGLSHIEDGALEFTSLRQLKLPSSIRFLGMLALDNVPLTTLALPEGLEIIDRSCFCQMPLRHITLPASLQQLGDRAFYQCRKLKTVTVLGRETQLGEDVFQGCGPLTVRCYADSTMARYVQEEASITLEFLP